jgi:antitoxin (DNA-binding transcriptional repressor) of toxin-antitoxin stability system
MARIQRRAVFDAGRAARLAFLCCAPQLARWPTLTPIDEVWRETLLFVMSDTVSIRDLRLNFRKVKQQVEEHGTVTITDNGIPSYELRAVSPAVKPRNRCRSTTRAWRNSGSFPPRNHGVCMKRIAAVTEPIYIDPSALSRLYFHQPGSKEMSDWRARHNKALLVTRHGRAELDCLSPIPRALSPR